MQQAISAWWKAPKTAAAAFEADGGWNATGTSARQHRCQLRPVFHGVVLTIAPRVRLYRHRWLAQAWLATQAASR
jgi:hypothetical protein